MCWFDYTHLSDAERDERFASAYLKAYRLRYARRTDAIKARFVNPVSKRNKRAWVAIPKARQSADDLSIPYEYYCRFAIELTDEAGWTYLAQPHQLYSEAMRALIADRWETLLRYQVVLPENPCSLPKFHSYIKALASHRKNPHHFVYDLLKKRRIDREIAEQLFDKDVLSRVSDLEVVCGSIAH